MLRAPLLLSLLCLAGGRGAEALPYRPKNDLGKSGEKEVEGQGRGGGGDDSCKYPGTCTPPSSLYSNVAPNIARHQWAYSGGYCGSVSIQSLAMTHGAWISQNEVRKSAPPGGGHGNASFGYEILHTNIEQALTTLKLTYNPFDYKSTPQPQYPYFLSFLKQNLVAGNGVVWFIMCAGDEHNAYNVGVYDHIEPVWGIYSNRSLSDPTVYPDDVLVHGSDYSPDGAANLGYFRRFDSLVDTVKMNTNCSKAIPKYGYNEMYPCVMHDIDYGYAITGQKGETLPVYIHVNHLDEPNIAAGEKPINLTVTITSNGLQSGKDFSVYRWDSYKSIPDSAEEYANTASYTYPFTATGTTHTLEDPNPCLSSGVCYYRVTATAAEPPHKQGQEVKSSQKSALK